MRAYKFRSADQAKYAFDILFHERLFCSDWSKLNDPMEGIFTHDTTISGSDHLERVVDDIKLWKKKRKVCSLSKTFENILLWSHYADGFKGMALEVELPRNCEAIADVAYEQSRPCVSDSNDDATNDLAKQTLSSKHPIWEYEQEVRILHDSQWYALGAPIKRVILGHRMDESLVDAFEIICESKNVATARTAINDSNTVCIST